MSWSSPSDHSATSASVDASDLERDDMVLRLPAAGAQCADGIEALLVDDWLLGKGADQAHLGLALPHDAATGQIAAPAIPAASIECNSSAAAPFFFSGSFGMSPASPDPPAAVKREPTGAGRVKGKRALEQPAPACTNTQTDHARSKENQESEGRYQGADSATGANAASQDIAHPPHSLYAQKKRRTVQDDPKFAGMKLSIR